MALLQARAIWEVNEMRSHIILAELLAAGLDPRLDADAVDIGEIIERTLGPDRRQLQRAVDAQTASLKAHFAAVPELAVLFNEA